jgi:hypothetical protein
MKKNNRVFLVTIFLASILLTACRTGGRNVDDCDPAEGCHKINILVAGRQDTFLCLRNPAAVNGYAFIYRREPLMQSALNIIKDLGWTASLYSGDTSPIALILYTGSEIREDADLKKEDIDGILVYYKTGSAMFTEAYAVRGDILEKNTALSAESGIFSPDDIQAIARLLPADHPANSAIAWIDFDELPKAAHRLSALQKHIEQQPKKGK